MQIGACGICCDACYAFKENAGTCWGCNPGPEASARKLEASPCPIIKCAAGQKIDFCGKSCGGFPCDLYTSLPHPYSHQYLKVITKEIPRKEKQAREIGRA